MLLLLLLSSCAVNRPARYDDVKNPTAFSTQIVVVESPGWDSLTGTLQCFERNELGGAWKPVGERVPVDFGRTGLAWGRGLQGGRLGSGPEKREGDGKSPAGVFRLSAVFGYAPADSMQFLKMPYVPATSTCQCVDDPGSAYYNLVLDSLSVAKPDWNSHENMHQLDDSYKWGVLVDHNMSPREAGDGSCIFLHVWGGPTTTTSGCTAMDEAKIYSIIRWLDAGRNPVLVQLPEAEYASWKRPWSLP